MPNCYCRPPRQTLMVTFLKLLYKIHVMFRNCLMFPDFHQSRNPQACSLQETHADYLCIAHPRTPYVEFGSSRIPNNAPLLNFSSIQHGYLFNHSFLCATTGLPAFGKSIQLSSIFPYDSTLPPNFYPLWSLVIHAGNCYPPFSSFKRLWAWMLALGGFC